MEPFAARERIGEAARATAATTINAAAIVVGSFYHLQISFRRWLGINRSSGAVHVSTISSRELRQFIRVMHSGIAAICYECHR